MGTAFACFIVFSSHSLRAKIIASESCPKITSFEKDFDKITYNIPVKTSGFTFSNPEARQSKYRKKFQMGTDSHIEFKAEETFVYKVSKHFLEVTINYHTPNVTTAVVLFIYRLASF